MKNAPYASSTHRFVAPGLRASLAATTALVIAWFLANHTTQPDEFLFELSVTHVILVSGAVPWLLQLSAVLLLLASCSRLCSRDKPALKFAGCTTAAVGVGWWCGMAVTYHGQTLLDALTDTLMASVEHQFTGEGMFCILLHRVCGPLISFLQVRGLVTLAGEGFFYSMASVTFLMGYLTLVAAGCGVGGSRPPSACNVIRFAFLIFLLFVPGLIRFSLEMTRGST